MNGQTGLATGPTAQNLLSPAFSVYLDLVRFLAAMIVFLEHAQLSGLLVRLPVVGHLATEAVAAFFVLSGYIIAATTDKRRGWREFAVARAARLYSVVIPAVLLGFALNYGFALFAKVDAASLQQPEPFALWHLPLILGLSGELWTLHVPIPWDGPIWSLDYEAYYYLMFGVLTFGAGRSRLIAAACIALLAGPKIVLLMPCWWLGVLLARRPGLAWRSRTWAWIILFAAPLLLWGANRAGLEEFIKYRILWPHLPGFWRLQDAENFVTYYIDAVVIAGAFVAARQLDFSPRSVLMRAAPAIRWAAGYTFSLYLFHRPLQNLAQQFFQATPQSELTSVILLTAILACVAVLGSFTEKRKTIWRRLFTVVFRAPARNTPPALSEPVVRGASI